MKETSTRKMVLKWANKIGLIEAETELRKQGIPLSTVQKLLAGKYPNEPADLLESAIHRAMKGK